MRQILTAEVLDQQEWGVGALQHEVAQHPDSLHPGSQRVRCHEEHYATAPLPPACEPLGPLRVLPRHTFLPAKFAIFMHRGISRMQEYSATPASKKYPVAWVRKRPIMVSAMDPYGRVLCFLDWSRYFFFQVAPRVYSRGWVDPVPDPLLVRKSGSVGNRTRTSASVARNSDR
jgi:hypothetical protein